MRLFTRRMMRKGRFEAAYAASAGVTVKFLRRHGLYAKPCRCGADGCEGWVMGFRPVL